MKGFKTTFNITLLFFLFGSTFAQEIEWNHQLQRSKSKDFFLNFKGDDNNNVYCVLSDDGNSFLTAFSRSSLEPIFKKKIPKLTVNNEKVHIFKTILLKDKFVLFGTFYKKNKKTKKQAKSIKYNMVAFTADKYSGEINTKPIWLHKVDVEKKRKSGQFKLYYAPDNSKILITHSAYYKKKKRTIATFKLFNDNLDLIQEFSEEYKRNDSEKENKLGKDIRNIVIDKEGSIYYTIGLSKFVSLDVNKNYEKRVQKISIENFAKNGKGSNSRFIFDKKGNLILFGLYSEYSDREKHLILTDGGNGYYDGGLKGIYYIKINLDSKEILAQKTSNFDASFLKNFMTWREKRRDSKGMPIYIENIFSRFNFFLEEDASLTVVAEAYSHDYGYTWVYEKGQSKRKYLSSETIKYDDVIVFNVSSSGNLKWAQHIPKKQYFYQRTDEDRSYTFGSFQTPLNKLLPSTIFQKGGFVNQYHYTKYFSTISYVKDGKIVLIYNNHLKNNFTTLKKDLKKLKRIKTAYVDARALDQKTGEIKAKKVLNGTQKQSPLCTRVYYKTSDNESIIVFGQKNKKYRIGKLVLN